MGDWCQYRDLGLEIGVRRGIQDRGLVSGKGSKMGIWVRGGMQDRGLELGEGSRLRYWC